MYQTGAGYNRDQIGPRYGDDDPGWGASIMNPDDKGGLEGFTIKR